MNLSTTRVLNIRLFKVGGIWFLKLGRINLSFSVSRELRGFEHGSAMVCSRGCLEH